MVGCIPKDLMLLLTPILTNIHMVYVRAPYMSYMLYVSYVSYMTYMTSGIWHANIKKRFYVSIEIDEILAKQ